MALPAFELPHHPPLASLVAECMARVRRRLDDPRLDDDLRARFVAYWDAIEAAHERRRCSGRVAGALPGWLSSVAGLMLLVVASEGGAIDDAVLDAAAGCELYVLSVTLFDAIQDDELEGPMSDLPTPVAINAALILFIHGCEAIFQLADRLAPALQRRLREVFVTRSLILGRGQHRDLRCVRPDSLDLAAAQAQDKTEAIPMAAELGALAAGCDPTRAGLYAHIGRRSALLRQCGNDLSDLYGKHESVDLRTGKWTLPLVAYWGQADAAGQAEFMRLRGELPGSLEGIRQLVFESGAVRQVAFVMERARRDIHAAIAELGRGDGPIALLGAHADLTAARLYTPTGAR